MAVTPFGMGKLTDAAGPDDYSENPFKFLFFTVRRFALNSVRQHQDYHKYINTCSQVHMKIINAQTLILN